MINVAGGRENEIFFCHFLTTKDTKSTKDYRTKRLMPFWSSVRLKLISVPIGTLARLLNSIFVSFVSFVVELGASCANGVDDQIILVRKNCAQVEFKPAVVDVTNHWRRE